MNAVSPSPESPLYAGIDVGGTNIKLGVVDDHGRVLAQGSFPTQQHLGPEYAVAQSHERLTEICRQAGIAYERIAAVGLGTPGTMDLSRGRILEPPNLPGWRHFPIRDRLSEAMKRPVTYVNDANAAAFGEFWVGSGREYSSLILFTLGTGVGGGIVIDDLLIEGAHSLGGEVGHIRIDWSGAARKCSCGSPGHLEAYASATALVARARQERQRAGRQGLGQIAADDLTALRVAEAAECGDSLAQELIFEVADSLARGIAIVANLLDPQAVLLGGAMTFGGSTSPLGRSFLERVRTQVALEIFPQISASLVMDFAALGSDAGFVGAAGWARLHARRNQSTPA